MGSLLSEREVVTAPHEGATGHTRVLSVPARPMPHPRVVMTDNTLTHAQIAQDGASPLRATGQSVPKAFLLCSDSMTAPTSGSMANTNLKARLALQGPCPAVTLSSRVARLARHPQHCLNGAWARLCGRGP